MPVSVLRDGAGQAHRRPARASTSSWSTRSLRGAGAPARRAQPGGWDGGWRRAPGGDGGRRDGKRAAAAGTERDRDRFRGPSPPPEPVDPRAALARREQSEEAFLAYCIALPEEGERRLAAVEIDDYFSSPATRKAAALPPRAPAPPGGEPARSGDEDLARLVAKLVVRAEPARGDAREARARGAPARPAPARAPHLRAPGSRRDDRRRRARGRAPAGARRDPPSASPEQPFPSDTRTSVRIVMDRETLAAMLAEGRSIESIARETGRAASTVAYWVNKHGLTLAARARHAARGGIERERARGARRGRPLDPRRSASRCGVSAHDGAALAPAIRARRRRALAARRDGAGARRRRRDASRRSAPSTVGRRSCGVGADGYTAARCCNTKRVSDGAARQGDPRRRGGRRAASLCGYDAYVGALQFHHVDPATKSFDVSRQGVTRSLERARAEARKCVLLCANCHAKVEAGTAICPPRYYYEVTAVQRPRSRG